MKSIQIGSCNSSNKRGTERIMKSRYTFIAAKTLGACITAVCLAAACARGSLLLQYTFEPGTVNDSSGTISDVSGAPINNAIYGGGNGWEIEPIYDTPRGSVLYVISPRSIAIANTGVIATNGHFTICGWYKGTGTGYFFDQAGTRMYLNVGAGGALSLYHTDTSYFGSITPFNDDRWHHVALVVTNNSTDAVFSIYVDGQAGDVDNTQDGVQLTRTTTGKGLLKLRQQSGNYRQRFAADFGGANNLNGCYDDLRIYETALSAAEVLALYNATVVADTGVTPVSTVIATFNDLIFMDFQGAGGGTGFGANKWDDAGTTYANIISGNLGSDLYPIRQGGQPRMMSITGSGTLRGGRRAFETAMTGEIWFSFLGQNSSGSSFGLTFNPTSASDLRPDMIRFGSTVSGYNKVRRNAVDTTIAAATHTAGVTRLIVGRLIINSNGANDKLTLWMDPNLVDEDGISNDTPVFDDSSVDFVDGSVLSSVGLIGGDNSLMDCLLVSDQETAYYDVTGLSPKIATVICIR